MIWYFPERIFWQAVRIPIHHPNHNGMLQMLWVLQSSKLREPCFESGNWCPATAGDINQAQIVTEPVVSAS